MFSFFKKKTTRNPDHHLRTLITSLHTKTRFVSGPNDLQGIAAYEKLKDLPTNEIKALILQLIDHISELSILIAKSHTGNLYNHEDYNCYARNIGFSLLDGLLRRKLYYNEAEWMELFEKFAQGRTSKAEFGGFYFDLSNLPINYAIKQLENHLKDHAPSDKLRVFIQQMLQWEEFADATDRRNYGSDLFKAGDRLEKLIRKDGEAATFALRNPDVGQEFNQIIQHVTKHKSNYNKVFHLALRASGGKPTKNFLTKVDLQIDAIGRENFRKTVHQLLLIPIQHQAYEKTHTYERLGSVYHYTEILFLSKSIQDFIKGLVWTCHRFSDRETIQLLSRLAEKMYAKIPGKGPAAASVGNACIFILGNMRGKDGLGALARLKLKVRQNNTKKTIDKYLREGAEKYQVSVEELKEMAVPDYGLKAGTKQLEFADYTLQVSIEGAKVVQQWSKPDGSSMKSVPAIVKKTPALTKKLQNIRKEIKEIQKIYTAQKQRIDNQFILDRTWDYATFQKYYLDHGLVQPIATQMIWSFTKEDQTVDAIRIDESWRTVQDEAVDWVDNETEVKLWHPIHATEDQIVQWRAKMIDLTWKQPVKQAFREIYVLTDAEINTRTYSNRMAAHILKQHQFASLAAIRDWKYALLGWYDDGRANETCYKLLPKHNLKAEFWIDELNQDGAFNEAGIWLYISTDQVKFTDVNGETLELTSVPKIVFSEIMRDVDLFVGVSSVGNDPAWIDNNGERQAYRDYWHSYSFGDLSEIAKTRKDILQNLLPRLKKIRDKAKVEGRFLVVNGKLRTYKIHIGSGNILMEPNDQYLCIVPARTALWSSNKLFIPFEGDRGLSIVLSKAFLLAEDDKIMDGTIVRQINRGI